MKCSDFILPFCVSAVIHICLFSSGNSYQDIEIAYGRETQTITMNIAPPLTNRVSTAPSFKISHRSTKTSPAKDTQRLAKTDPVSRQEVKATKAQQEQTNSALRPSEIVTTPHTDTGRTGNMTGRDVYQNKDNRLPDNRQMSGHTSPEPGFTDCEIPLEEESVIMDEGVLESANEAVTLENPDTGPEKDEIMVPAKIPGLLKPPYPRYSRRYGEKGTVLISMEVHANGKPGRIEIISSSGYSRLDHAATRAIKKATFIPASINGKAISSSKQIAVTFELSK